MTETLRLTLVQLVRFPLYFKGDVSPRPLFGLWGTDRLPTWKLRRIPVQQAVFIENTISPLRWQITGRNLWYNPTNGLNKCEFHNDSPPILAHVAITRL